MKRILLYVVATFMISVAGTLISNAQKVYTVDGLKYMILDEESVELRGSVNVIEGEFVIPSKVIIEKKEYKVSSIGDEAFSRDEMRSIKVPASVTHIKTSAFLSCKNLTCISFDDADEPLTFKRGSYGTFYLCPVDSLYMGRDFVFVENVSSWESRIGILSSLKDLRSIHIGAKVNTLEDRLFEGCYSLKNVIIDEGLKEIGKEAFHYASSLSEVHLPKSLRTIDDYAFSSCPSLANVVIEEGLQRIGKGAFNIASSLTTIHLPQSLTTMGNYAFYKSGLQEITLPANLKRIGEEAFSNSPNLTIVHFPEGVDSLDKKAFYGCTSLQRIELPNSLSYVGPSAFEGCYSLASVHAGKSLHVIAEKAFYKCSSLSDLVLSDTMDAIGKLAFSYCDALQTFEFPDGLTEIYSSTLSFSHGIKKLIYGKDIEKMDALGIDGFSTKIQLDTIVVRFSRPVEYPKNYESNLIVKVPHGCGCDFRKAKGWSSHIIMEENEEEICVNVNEPGSLYNELNKQIAPNLVGKLKVTGLLNDNDWKVLQKAKTGFLYSIDLSEVTNTSIPASQFNGKSWLTDIKLPQGLETISDNAFYGCSRLTGRLELPTSFKLFGRSSMSRSNISEIVLNSEVSVNNQAFEYCSRLESITSDSIVSIGSTAFAFCPALVKFRTNQKITIINSCTFSGCSGLKEVIISEGGQTIDYNAFDGCNSLKVILIPSTMQSINAFAFYNCNNLQDVYAFGDVPCGCNQNAFKSIPQDATLHVPNGKEGDYAVARGWEVFMNIVSFEPSSIDKTPEEIHTMSHFIYDLNGRMVDNPIHGRIYIINGKKMVFKSELSIENNNFY